MGALTVTFASIAWGIHDVTATRLHPSIRWQVCPGCPCVPQEIARKMSVAHARAPRMLARAGRNRRPVQLRGKGLRSIADNQRYTASSPPRQGGPAATVAYCCTVVSTSTEPRWEKITSALTEGGVRAHPRMDFPSHVAMRHGIVVDNDPFTSSGRLAKVACAQGWPNTVTASLQVAQNALDPFLAQLPRRTMTVASQSRRICGKAWLTNRSTGKSRPRQRTERQQQKGDHHE